MTNDTLTQTTADTTTAPKRGRRPSTEAEKAATRAAFILRQREERVAAGHAVQLSAGRPSSNPEVIAERAAEAIAAAKQALADAEARLAEERAVTLAALTEEAERVAAQRAEQDAERAKAKADKEAEEAKAKAERKEAREAKRAAKAQEAAERKEAVAERRAQREAAKAETPKAKAERVIAGIESVKTNRLSKADIATLAEVVSIARTIK
jgi:hypothetical protein